LTRRRAFAGYLVASGLLIGAGGLYGVVRAPPARASKDPSCVVARWQGGALTVSDVRELRAAVAPAPAIADSPRWAVDVALTAWDRGLGEATPPERVRAYRDWVAGEDGRRPSALEARRVARSLAELRERAGLEPGPCFQAEDG
jgi:hypothetical protein